MKIDPANKIGRPKIIVTPLTIQFKKMLIDNYNVQSKHTLKTDICIATSLITDEQKDSGGLMLT